MSLNSGISGNLIVQAVLLAGLCAAPAVFAQNATPAPSPAPGAEGAGSDAESLDVENIKKKYWATGDESSIGVVQNRLYSKAGKVQIGLNAGVSFNDPFVSTRSFGASLGYFFNETWGLNVLAWKNFNSDSKAYGTLVANNIDTDRVRTSSYLGLEGSYSLLYGKLSLLGRSIIYYDMNLMAGVGVARTEAGCGDTDLSAPCDLLWTAKKNEPAFHLGIGQRFYMTKCLSLKVDYRMMYSGETLREQTITSKFNEVKGRRDAYTHAIRLGFDVLFGFDRKKSQ